MKPFIPMYKFIRDEVNSLVPKLFTKSATDYIITRKNKKQNLIVLIYMLNFHERSLAIYIVIMFSWI